MRRLDDVIIIINIMVFCTQGSAGGSNIFGCPPSQHFEFGSRGLISCTFPTNLSEIYWYDDVSGRSDIPAIAGYRLSNHEKSGQGVEGGDYDILPNGTLVIRNVTLRHEKQYKVLACTTRNCNPSSPLSVVVTVSPRARTPSVESCNDETPCLVSLPKFRNLTCHYETARPPVELEWVEKLNGNEMPIEGQNSFSRLKNGTVAYTSYAILHETMISGSLLLVYSCKPRWIFPYMVTEQNILVDLSKESDYINLPTYDTVYYEINRRAELRCGTSSFPQVVWKKIGSNGNFKTIAFKYGGTANMSIQFADEIHLSSDGSLTFTSLQLHHEGIYACIYDNGEDLRGIQSRNLQVLVPPSPPYVQIEECKDNPRCQFNGSRSGSLTCFIRGVRPEVSLQWLVSDATVVTLHDSKVEIRHREELTDVSISLRYELADDLACGYTVVIKCEVGHPISQIIQPYSEIYISSAECSVTTEDEYKENTTEISVSIIIALGCFLIVCTLLCLFFISNKSGKFRTKDFVFCKNGRRKQNNKAEDHKKDMPIDTPMLNNYDGQLP